MGKPLPERRFEAVDPSTLPTPALSIGLAGPPGGGKTKSALRIADGIARVRGGKPVVIETEPGRVAKYLRGPRNPDGHDFHLIPFAPPFAPEYFLAAIKQAEERYKPAAIIVDSASDEHEGEGGVLDWHDKEVPNSGGNEWAAWKDPKKSRRKLITGLEHIRTPIILTFRAREKTTTQKQQGRDGRVRDVPVNIGFVPVAPLEIVHALDLVALLPPRANGVAVWSSAKAGEDFTIKIPEYLAPMIVQGDVLNEDLGEALARWQRGDVDDNGVAKAEAKAARSPQDLVDGYVARVNAIEDLGELRAFQMEERTRKFVEGVKAKHPALFDRIVEANSRRAAALEPQGADNGQTNDDENDVEFPSDPSLENPGGD
jgi:hypothetical protein